MTLSDKLKTLFRGDISIRHLPLEYLRRRNAAKRRRTERESLDELNARPARLLPEFAKLSSADLLEHFRTRQTPAFWPAVPAVWSAEDVVRDANGIVNDSTWEVMGFGPIRFEGVDRWRRDPLSGHDWGLEHHADTQLYRDDGSDVRVLWEVNRLGHAVTLALAYRKTGDERCAETFFQHVESWIEQNPYARGANWGCAMEVALRVANLLAALDIFRTSKKLTSERLALLLKLFDQHGRFIVDNSEFSYVATSNHYLSDVVGLFWIGTMIPELEHAIEWRLTGLKEMLSEMDKQILSDGVDFEASTGYHRFVTEMFLMTFLLVRVNGIEIANRYWQKLTAMLTFIRDITRPDGRMPLIGDCDGTRFVPITRSDADETKYLLDLGADLLTKREAIASVAYPAAGIYILRDDDLFLSFNASDCGLNGRGSHGHNDALSIEVSAFGVPFIIDPGSYVYNLDREARHAFRSTAYHSTVMIDGLEQSTTDKDTPFVIGNEAKPRVIEWSTDDRTDIVSAEHRGYARLSQPIVHRRTVTFSMSERIWTIEDELTARGRHDVQTVIHFAPDITVALIDEKVIKACDNSSGKYLVLTVEGYEELPVIIEGFVSRAYGEKLSSKIVRITGNVECPAKFRWTISAKDD